MYVKLCDNEESKYIHSENMHSFLSNDLNIMNRINLIYSFAFKKVRSGYISVLDYF